jgi:fructose transport system ATP-binding protein
MDEPTAALGVRETNQVLDLILRVRDNGLPVVLISHNMPNVFQVADRIHIHRLGRRIALVEAKNTTMEEAVAIMTGAKSPGEGLDPSPEQPSEQAAPTALSKGEQ